MFVQGYGFVLSGEARNQREGSERNEDFCDDFHNFRCISGCFFDDPFHLSNAISGRQTAHLLCGKRQSGLQHRAWTRWGRGEFAALASERISTGHWPRPKRFLHMSSISEIPYRDLVRTGERVSCIVLDRWHLALPQEQDNLATRIVRTAVDRGINFMDNSWDYNDGESEKRMGKALREGYRERVFLMTKIDGR